MKYYNEIAEALLEFGIEKEDITPDTTFVSLGIDDLDMAELCVAIEKKYNLFIDFGYIELYDIFVYDRSMDHGGVEIRDLCNLTYPQNSDISKKITYALDNAITEKRIKFKSLISRSLGGLSYEDQSEIINKQLEEFDSDIIKERIKLDYERVKKISYSITDQGYPDINAKLENQRTLLKKHYELLVGRKYYGIDSSPIHKRTIEGGNEFASYEEHFKAISLEIRNRRTEEAELAVAEKKAAENRKLIVTLLKIVISAIVAYIGYKYVGGLWWWIAGFAIFNGGWMLIYPLFEIIVSLLVSLLKMAIYIAAICLIIAAIVYFLF